MSTMIIERRLGMKKGLPLNKRLDALEARAQKVEIEAIMLKTAELCADIRDAQTVVAVATETWSGQQDSFVGVLDLLGYKLGQIERTAQRIMALRPQLKGR